MVPECVVDLLETVEVRKKDRQQAVLFKARQSMLHAIANRVRFGSPVRES